MVFYFSAAQLYYGSVSDPFDILSTDPFDILSTESASVDSLKRWRQAALVLNASRRYRYTLDLKKEEEKKQIIAKIRTHAQVIREIYLFQSCGEKADGDYDVSPGKLASMTRDRDLIVLQKCGLKAALALVLNASRRFRYTLDLKKKGREETNHQKNQNSSEAYPFQSNREKADVPKFDELFPPQEDTKEKIQNFWNLSEEKRSFKIMVDCQSKEDFNTSLVVKDHEPINMSTGSWLTRSGAPFSSSFNVEDFISSSPSVEIEKSPNPRARKLETKPKNPEPQKRKVTLEMGQEIFEGLSPFEIKQKMITLHQAAMNLMLKGAEESKRQLELILVAKEKELKKKDKDLAAKIKELNVRKEELYVKNGELSDKKEELERLVEECNELKDQLEGMENEARKFTARSVLEAKLKMMDDIEKGNESSWDRAKWEQALRKLKGEEGTSEVAEKVDESGNDVGGREGQNVEDPKEGEGGIP